MKKKQSSAPLLLAVSAIVVVTMSAMYTISPTPTTGNPLCPSPTVTSSQAQTTAQTEATNEGYSISSTTTELLTFGEIAYWHGITIKDDFGTGATCAWYVAMEVSKTGSAFTEMHVSVDPNQGGIISTSQITDDGSYSVTVTPTPTGTIPASATPTVTITPPVAPTGTVTLNPTLTPTP